jgi:diguanylate cyclase (GGDEF)-like protein
MADLDKHLERAEKYITKGKFGPAVQEYKAAYDLAPQNLNLLRTLADLCVRAGQNDNAVHYYGELFDKYAEKNDVSKGIPLFRKSLQGSPQPPERYDRLGRLLQGAKKTDEALEAYHTALDLYRKAGNATGVLDSLERLAALEPDSAYSQIALGDQANQMGKAELAAKAFLRAGQLLRADDLDRALELLQRAYQLAPERSTALSLAQAYLDNGKPQQAAELLEPLYAESENDPAVLETLATALLNASRLPQAEEVLEVFYQSKPNGYEKLFELADLYCKGNQAEKGVEVLRRVKQRLFAAKRQKVFLPRLEEVFQANDAVTPLAEFAASTFNELNQESRYGMVLEKLFELYYQGQDFKRAADTLERLIDIDPYDFENQKRIQKLKDKIDPARMRSISARIASAATVPGQAPALSMEEEQEPDLSGLDPARRRALLDDMIVQVEIFLQYSLKAKAIEKLQKIHQNFPGEEAGNERLYRLFEMAQYFPEGLQTPSASGGAAAAAPAVPASPPTAPLSAETVSDLAKISEITHTLYRQNNPKTTLHAAISEVGKHLRSSRCLGVLGRLGKPPSTAVEYCAPGVPQSPGPAVMKLLSILSQLELNPETGAVLEVGLSPELKQVGAQSVLAMPLINKESQEQEGLIVLSQADRVRQWQPNEVYMLKAVADQVATAISHAKLRTLMKRLSVPEDASGLLARSSYLDCLVNEANRSKTQGTPLVVVLLELDKGGQWLRQLGDAALRKFMQQAGETVLASVRQTDLAFRYTATSIAVVLGDTTTEKIQPTVEKLRSRLNALALPGGKDSVSFSAGVSEAAVRPDYDPVDIATDVVNRAEFSLEEARQKGNAVVVR